MGLETRQSSGTYLNIMFGKLVQKVNANTQGAIERENKKGNTVYELYHDKLTGIIADAKIEESEYGARMVLTVNDNGETFFVQFNVDSPNGRSFLFKMNNMDFSTKITIAPYSFEDKDTERTVTGISFYQNDDKVMNTWTKDKPGKLPAMEKTTFKGKEVWDDTKRMKFLAKEFSKFDFSTPELVDADEGGSEEVAEDDLPF